MVYSTHKYHLLSLKIQFLEIIFHRIIIFKKSFLRDLQFFLELNGGNPIQKIFIRDEIFLLNSEIGANRMGVFLDSIYILQFFFFNIQKETQRKFHKISRFSVLKLKLFHSQKQSVLCPNAFIFANLKKCELVLRMIILPSY